MNMSTIENYAMRKNIKVSVIVPVYNVEQYLPECLDSVLNQTLKDIEIICVDDGSPDNSAAILQEYASRDNRIIYVFQENQGAGIARNTAILQAIGKYVVFIDPDDYYPNEQTLQTLYDAAENHNCLIAGGELLTIRQDGSTIKDSHTSFSDAGIIEFLDYQFDFHYQRFIFNRKLLLDNNILFPDYRRYEDPPFFVKAMYQAERFYAIPEVVYCYRLGSCSSINWAADDYRKLLDYIKGLSDDLQFAITHKLYHLQDLMAERILKKNWSFNIFVKHCTDERVKKASQKLMQLFTAVDRDAVIEKIYGTPLDSEKYSVRTEPLNQKDFYTPQISIIVPVYNVEQYLPECLDSLLNQTLKDIEIICVDDCSPDNSAAIMQEYAKHDKRIKNIHLSKNGGLSHARNEAMKQISGKYVYFIDSDDMLEPDALEKLHLLAENNNADMVLFLPQILSECENGNCFSRHYQDYPQTLTQRSYTGSYLFARMLEENRFVPSVCFKLIKSDLIQKHNISFIEGYIHEDNYFSIKTMLFAENVIAINDRFYIRRIRENSIMTAKDPNASLRHALGYAAAIGVLQSEIKQGNYSVKQQKSLQYFCATRTQLIYGYIIGFDDVQRLILLKKLSECPGNENWDYLVQLLYNFYDREKRYKEDIRKKNAELKKLKNAVKSRSYRLGRMLTWLPRKIRGGIRCLKDHGIVYMFRRLKR